MELQNTLTRQDTTRRETIRLFIQNQLNIATDDGDGGKTVDIEIGKDIKNINEDTTAIKQISGTYRTISTEFVSGMITDFLGKFVAVPNLEKIPYTIPMVFRCPNNELFVPFKEAMNKFTINMVGKNFKSSVPDEEYNFDTTIEEITNTEIIETINGQDFVKFSQMIFITSYKQGIITGNNIKYEIRENTVGDTGTYVEIDPYAKSRSINSTVANDPILNVPLTEGIIADSTWSFEGNIAFDENIAFLLDIAKSIYTENYNPDNGNTFNKIYDFKTTIATTTPITGTKQVVITQRSSDETRGKEMAFRLTLGIVKEDAPS